MRRLKKGCRVKIDPDKLKYMFYVFDVETTCLEPKKENFVFGVIYGYNYSKVIYSPEDFINEFKADRYRNKIIFAHNAEFDLLTIFGNIITEIDNEAIFNNKFITAKYNKVTFADSMNIYPTSVEKIGQLMGIEKLKNEKIRSEGLTKKNMNEQDIKYCKRDCKIVFIALLQMFTEIGAVKITISSLSMFLFRNDYLPADIVFSELVDEFYHSYYGGRTEAFHVGKTKAKVYDINSMYPYVMVNCTYPDIKKLKKEVVIDVKYLTYLIKVYEGLASVRIRHKETYFGYIPVRMKVNKSEKLVFPVGEFETVVNFNELRFALDQGVIEILKVNYVVYAPAMESPFIDFVNDFYKKKCGTDSPLMRKIYKLILNSLYGRFAMRLKMRTTYYDEIPFQIIQEFQDLEKYYDLKIFSAERKDCYLITENEQMKASFFSIPAFSSYITSEARIFILKNLLNNENSHPIYCDTDSIFLAGNFSGQLSERLGDFKLEEKLITEVTGLKNYKYINGTGEETVVIKGISRNSVKVSEGKYSVKKYYKTKGALRQSQEAGQAFVQIKELRHRYDKRLVNQYGDTRPLKLPLIEDKKKSFDYREPESYYEAILRFFASGGKVRKQDVIDNVTGKSKEIELYKSLTDPEGVSMDSFNERVSEQFAVERPIEKFIEVLDRFHNISQVKKELKRITAESESTLKFAVFEDDYKDVPF